MKQWYFDDKNGNVGIIKANSAKDFILKFINLMDSRDNTFVLDLMDRLEETMDVDIISLDVKVYE